MIWLVHLTIASRRSSSPQVGPGGAVWPAASQRFGSRVLMTGLALKLIETIPRARQMMVMRLRQHGVRRSVAQLQVLELVRGHPRTVSELAELQAVTKATMSATLSRMADEGLLRRSHAPDDHRQIIVGPTAKGRAVSEGARKEAEAILDEILACLSSEDRDALMRGVDLLNSAVERAHGSP